MLAELRLYDGRTLKQISKLIIVLLPSASLSTFDIPYQTLSIKCFIYGDCAVPYLLTLAKVKFVLKLRCVCEIDSLQDFHNLVLILEFFFFFKVNTGSQCSYIKFSLRRSLSLICNFLPLSNIALKHPSVFLRTLDETLSFLRILNSWL